MEVEEEQEEVEGSVEALGWEEMAKDAEDDEEEDQGEEVIFSNM